MGKAEISIESKTVNNNNVIAITLEGDLTLNSSEEVKDRLSPLLSKNNAFELSIRNVENLDLSFVQMFYSFHKSVKAQGKTLTFNIQLPDSLQQLIDYAGFGNFEVLNVPAQ